nr:hypothetical protein [Tanacetum cinerariifolium]
VPQDYDVSSAIPRLFIHVIYAISLSFYPFTERHAQPYFFSCLIRQMVNTRTDADLSAAVQNALQALLPQIREEIREEFRTGSGSSNAGGNPPPVIIHTWLERFNKQKPHSFEKATAPGISKQGTMGTLVVMFWEFKLKMWLDYVLSFNIYLVLLIYEVTRPGPNISLRPNLGVLQIGIKSQGDDGDDEEESSEDDEDEEDDEMDVEVDELEEEEEHPAPADSVVVAPTA